MNNRFLREIERDREELRRKYSTPPKPVLYYDKLQQRNDLMGESNKSKETKTIIETGEMKLMKLTIYQSEYDYSPVVIVADDSRVIFNGDNMHDRGYSDFATGYAEGYELATKELVPIFDVFINELEELDEHENILKEIGFYDEFAESVDQ